MKRRDILALTMLLTCSMLLISCVTDESAEVASTNPVQVEQVAEVDSKEVSEIATSTEVTKAVEEVKPVETPTAPAKVDLNETVYATTSVNVRASAGTDGEAVGHLYSGDSVVRQELVGDWSRIDYNGGTAYVKSEYLSTTKPEVAVATTPSKPRSSGTGSGTSSGTSSSSSSTSTSSGSGSTGGETVSPPSGGGGTTSPPSTPKARVAHNHWGDYLTTDPAYGTLFTDSSFQEGYSIRVSQYQAFKDAGRIGTGKYTYVYNDGHTEECVGEYLKN